MTIPATDDPAAGSCPGAAGDEIFETFYAQNFHRYVGFAIFLGASRPDAADAVQQVMVGVWRFWTDRICLSRMAADPRDAYIKTAISRAVIDQNRRRTARLGLLAMLTSRFPVDFIVWQECVEETSPVVAMLQRLPQRQRMVLVLAAEGHTSQEIADLMGIRPSSVRSHLQKARKKLRKALGDQGEQP
ncbi:sigma-70 family RNA polymerase sigma factor [Actinoplanes sp. NPDC026670]|uniref:RNA polymerase sigma factor n=1 Tax=Actinoplanes sp. NPDC026670 TaxID=3154700 RepID=UPI0034107330